MIAARYTDAIISGKERGGRKNERPELDAALARTESPVPGFRGDRRAELLLSGPPTSGEGNLPGSRFLVPASHCFLGVFFTFPCDRRVAKAEMTGWFAATAQGPVTAL